MESGGLAQRAERLVLLSFRFERGRDLSELLDGDGALAGPRQVALTDVHVEQALADLLVIGIQLGGLAQRLDRLVLAPFAGELLGDRLEVVHRPTDIAQFDAGGGGGQAAFVVLRVERAEPDLRVDGTARIPLALPQVDQRLEVGAGVGVEPLAAEDVRDLDERVLVVGLELENLLVDGAGLGDRPFVAETVGDLA